MGKPLHSPYQVRPASLTEFAEDLVERVSDRGRLEGRPRIHTTPRTTTKLYCATELLSWYHEMANELYGGKHYMRNTLIERALMEFRDRHPNLSSLKEHDD